MRFLINGVWIVDTGGIELRNTEGITNFRISL